MLRSLGSVVLLGLGLVLLAGCSFYPDTPKVVAVAPSQVVHSSMVVGRPTISADFINQVLTFYQSPARGKGQALYDEGVRSKIDPVYALAFFLHESSFGRHGVAAHSLSLGNLRCIPDALCKDGYAWFPSWEEGFRAWYRLIAGPLYVGDNLLTVEQIIPRYAPSVENDVLAYVRSVNHAVTTWRAGRIAV